MEGGFQVEKIIQEKLREIEEKERNFEKAGTR